MEKYKKNHSIQKLKYETERGKNMAINSIKTENMIEFFVERFGRLQMTQVKWWTLADIAFYRGM